MAVPATCVPRGEFAVFSGKILPNVRGARPTEPNAPTFESGKSWGPKVFEKM